MAGVTPMPQVEEMKLEVGCYSGRTADERPVRFRLEDCQYIPSASPTSRIGWDVIASKVSRSGQPKTPRQSRWKSRPAPTATGL